MLGLLTIMGFISFIEFIITGALGFKVLTIVGLISFIVEIIGIVRIARDL